MTIDCLLAEPPERTAADEFHDDRIRLTFLGNRKDALYLLMENRSSFASHAEPEETMYFCSTPQGVAGLFWADAVSVQDNQRVYLDGWIRRPFPFTGAHFHQKLYRKVFFDSVYDLVTSNNPEGAARLYDELRADFGYAKDSTRIKRSPLSYPLLMITPQFRTRAKAIRDLGIYVGMVASNYLVCETVLLGQVSPMYHRLVFPAFAAGAYMISKRKDLRAKP